MAQIEEETRIVNVEIKFGTELHKDVPLDLNGSLIKF
jgi:hypothetical protein